jgi:hypothetical protein
MKRKALLNLLAAHADALNRQDRRAEWTPDAWLADVAPAARYSPALLELLQLAQAVQQALTPVRPSADFRLAARVQLLAQSPQVDGPEPEQRRGFWLGAAVVGSMLSLTGLVLVLLRRVRSLSPAPPIQTAGSPLTSDVPLS